MPKWKKAVLLCLCFALILPTFSFTARAEGNTTVSMPTVSAEGAVLLEGDSGARVYAKNADTRMPMASTTKIMTALVALESASPDTVISAPACAVGTEGSSIYLIEGEALTLEQLLYALMLESANDAAVAIAVGIAGSVEAFAELMNRKAEALGLTDTHFTNPHGLDDADHYTTPYELAVIARCAMQNELLRTIASTRKTTIPHAGTDSVRLLVNHNKMLRLYDGCIGLKTGFTKQSGRCLVSAAERDGVVMIAVTLRAPNDWDDHKHLLDYGFARYTSVTLCETEAHRYALPIVGGKDTYVTLVNSEPLCVTLPVDHAPITQRIEARRFEFAAISAGEELGRVIYECDLDGDGNVEQIATVALRAAYAVERTEVKKSIWRRILEFFGF